jgi:hypothetical protein
VRFNFDVYDGPGADQVKHLGERRDRHPGRQYVPPNGCMREVANGGVGRVGRSFQWLERWVMVYHQNAINRQVHVEFDPIGTGIECVPEARERILGVVARRASMRDDF